MRSLPIALLLAAACCLSSRVAAAAEAASASGASADWRFDSVRTVGGAAATILGNPSVASGVSGAWVQFNGKADALTFDASPIAGWAAFTIQVRFRADADGPAAQRFIHIEDAEGHRLTFETRVTPDGAWALDTFLLFGSSRCTLLDMKRLHPCGGWHWAALTYENGHMSSFVDGEPELSGSVAFGAMVPSAHMAVGVRLNRVYWFKGSISEIRFAPTALAGPQLAREAPP